jgi:hypothetical protein
MTDIARLIVAIVRVVAISRVERTDDGRGTLRSGGESNTSGKTIGAFKGALERREVKRKREGEGIRSECE